MLQETQDGDGLAVERIAALDIGKAEVACCVRVPSPRGKGGRAQEVATYSTMTRSAAGAGGPVAGAGGVAGGDGGDQRLLEAGVLPVGGGRVRGVAGERQGCQAPAGAAEDRHDRCGV